MRKPSKKRGTDLSTEQLINIVQTVPPRTVKMNSVYAVILQFVKDLDVLPGEYEFPSQMVYELYIKWNQQKKLIDKRVFFREFNKLFKKKKYIYNQYYKLNLEPFKIGKSEHAKIVKTLKGEENAKYQEWRKNNRRNKLKSELKEEIIKEFIKEDSKE